MSRVLVVDDEPSVARNFQIMLQRAGHEVDTETDYVEAAKKIVSGGYDIVICDTNLGRGPPPLRGYQLFDYTRRKGVGVPFIGTSSLGLYGEDPRQEWEERGVRFIEKIPSNEQQYLDAIIELLGCNSTQKVS
jgi:DNA-binding NtrC family response regulator